MAIILVLLALASLALRVGRVPERIALLPDWSGYDRLLFWRLLALRGSIEYAPGVSVKERATGHSWFMVRCNDAECAPPQADERVIACLGGSTTWGYGVNDAETYPARLESLLNVSGAGRLRYRALNLAFPGTTTYDGVHEFTRVALESGASVAVIAYGGVNDSGLAYHQDRRYRTYFPPLRVARSFAWYRFAESLWYRLVLFPEPVPRVPEPEYVANLKAMETAFRARGATVVFLTERRLPGPEPLFPSRRSVQQNYRHAMLRLSQEIGTPVVDSEACLDDNSPGAYLADGTHWSPSGSRRIAECLAEVVRAFGRGER